MTSTRKPRQRVVIEPPQHLIKECTPVRRAEPEPATAPVTVMEADPQTGIDPLAWLLDVGPETEQNTINPDAQPEEECTVTEATEQAPDDLITLPEIFTIAEVAELHQSFSGALKDRPEDTALTVEASATRSTDTAALQLLFAVSQQARRQQTELLWNNPAEALIEGCKMLGLPEDMLSPVSAG